MKKTIVFDFDGVIHRYSQGWQNGSIYDEPVKGIKETIEELRRDYKIVVLSTRSSTEEGKQAILNWLQKYDIEVDDVVSNKPPATMYVDDRAVSFNGNCETLMRDIKNFKNWVEETRKVCPCCGKHFIKNNLDSRMKYCSIDCRIKTAIELARKRKDNETW